MSRKEYTSTSFQDDHKYIILCDQRYSTTQVQFWRRSKARLPSQKNNQCLTDINQCLTDISQF